jgi:putative flippase GtrA
LVTANTTGVISGFFVSYFLSLKTVFGACHGIGSFAIYVFTSGIGLVLANFLIATTYAFFITYFPEWFAFLLSKGFSIVVPFFVMYFMRKYLYIWLNKRRESHE